MTCTHIFRPKCPCFRPPLPATVALAPIDVPVVLPVALVALSAGQQAAEIIDPPPVPEGMLAKPRPVGQPRSPWRVRKEAEVAARAELEQRVMTAIQDGRGQEVLLGVQLALARVHFSTFCRLAWHVLEPSTYLDWGRHHELICTTMQALFEDWWAAKQDRDHIPLVRNTVFNCPPGSLKSKLIAVLFQAWVWVRAPGTKFVCVSVNEAAAMRDARDTRALMASEWYQASFAPEWRIKDDQDSISDFGNTDGGGRLSRASGSQIVGLRGDFFLGDDLNDPFRAGEQAERDNVNAIWDNNQYSRVNDMLRSQRICVQQRVHEDDHTGHVIKKQGLWSPADKDGWLQVVLPAEFEEKRAPFVLPKGLRKYVRALPGAELRDWRKKEGEFLHPARMTAESIASEKKRSAGTSNYACQYQQRPSAAGGGKVKKEWFGWFRLRGGVRPEVDEHETGRERPDGCRASDPIIIEAAHYRPGYWDFDLVALSIDPALKKTDRGSRWGMGAFGVKGGRRFLLDDRSERGEPDDAVKTIKEMVKVWMPDKMLIENKAGGEGIRRTLEIEMANGDMPMVEIVMINPGTQDKDARLNSAIPTMANGMLFLRDGAAWLEDYVGELSVFPNGTNDDRVDFTTQIINDLPVDEVGFPSAEQWQVASGQTLSPETKYRT